MWSVLLPFSPFILAGLIAGIWLISAIVFNAYFHEKLAYHRRLMDMMMTKQEEQQRYGK